MYVRVGVGRKLSTKELMLLNCGVGEDTWESLGLQEIQPVHPKGDQSWVFIGGTDAEAETPILWPPHVKSWLTGKDRDAGRDWGQEEKGTTEDEMAGWHHWLNGHGFEYTLGVCDGQGGLACRDSWGRKESDTTQWLNWMFSRFICDMYHYSILFCDWILFFMDLAHFVYLLIHLDCFHLLVAVYNATVNLYTRFCVTMLTKIKLNKIKVYWSTGEKESWCVYIYIYKEQINEMIG